MEGDPSGAGRRLGVVVATRDRPGLLSGALSALALAVRPGDELLVVDSASRTAATAELCAARGVAVLRVALPGTSRARNAGARALDVEVVAFTDDDCAPASGWAGALLAAFADPRVGVVTGRVVADRPAPAPVSLLLAGEPAPLDPARVVGHGANVAFRRDALLGVGGFDERLGPGAPGRAAEDADAIRRVLLAGWEGRYTPEAVVVHRQWRGRGAALARQWAYGVGQAHAGQLTDAVWSDGIRAAARDLGSGYLTGAAAGLLRTAGALSAAIPAVRAGRRRSCR